MEGWGAGNSRPLVLCSGHLLALQMFDPNLLLDTRDIFRAVVKPRPGDAAHQPSGVSAAPSGRLVLVRTGPAMSA